MKYQKFKSFAVVALALLAISCSENDDPVKVTVELNKTNLTYDDAGVWSQLATNTPVESQGFVFNHEGEDSPWGVIWQGFTPSRRSDVADHAGEWLTYQYNVMAGGGMSGVGTPFLVAFWNNTETAETPIENRTCRICYTGVAGGEKLPFKPQSIYVNNAGYTYYTMLNGDQYSKKFEAGDYLELKAHGIHQDGSESVVAIRLADCVGDDAGKWIVKDWTYFNLAELGEVTDVYFTLESTDVGQWGMNTPAYFCVDRLSAIVELPEN